MGKKPSVLHKKKKAVAQYLTVVFTIMWSALFLRTTPPHYMFKNDSLHPLLFTIAGGSTQNTHNNAAYIVATRLKGIKKHLMDELTQFRGGR